MRHVFAAMALVLWSGQVAAEVRAFDLQAQLQFDPNRIVSVDRRPLGALMTELVGPDAARGVASLSARIIYETHSMPGAINSVIAGYPHAIIGAGIRLGAVDLTLDLPLVRANAASSKIGLVADPDGGFCSDFEHCLNYGRANAPWGLQGFVLDNAASSLTDEAGTTTQTNDSLGFEMGRTAAVGEFSPGLATAQFGVVSVDGFAILLFSRPTGLMLSGLTIPPVQNLIGTAEIDRTEVWLYLEGPQLNGVVKVEGTISQIAVVQ